MNTLNLNEEMFQVVASITAVTEDYKKRLIGISNIMGEALQRSQQEIQRLTESLQTNQVITAWAEAQREWQQILMQNLAEAAKAFQELPEKTRIVLGILGENGWYLDDAMTVRQLVEPAEAFQRGEHHLANKELCHHYEKRRLEIKQFLMEKYPRRSPLLKSAFEAHDSEKYELAIPIFLSQTDGICKDLLGRSPFSRRFDRSISGDSLGTREMDSLTAAMLHPLTVPLPISASQTGRAKQPDVLHRHAVLHGESVDYGTKINSYKAMSLLY